MVELVDNIMQMYFVYINLMLMLAKFAKLLTGQVKLSSNVKLNTLRGSVL